MIPGLEYERSSSYEQQPDTYQTQNTQLHRRRPQTNGANGHSGHNGLSSGDDDKYSKRTRAVRKLDFFNKIEVDHIVRTERGGQLTAVGYVIMLVLILAEYFTWRGMNGESIEHVVVDTRYVFNLSFRCIVTSTLEVRMKKSFRPDGRHGTRVARR